MAGDFTYPQGKADNIEKVKLYIIEMIDAGFDIGGVTSAWNPRGGFRRLTRAGSVMLATVGTDGLGNYDREKGSRPRVFVCARQPSLRTTIMHSPYELLFLSTLALRRCLNF